MSIPYLDKGSSNPSLPMNKPAKNTSPSPPDEIEVRDLALAVAGEEIKRLNAHIAALGKQFRHATKLTRITMNRAGIRAAIIKECLALVDKAYEEEKTVFGIYVAIVAGLRALKEQK